MLTSEEKRKNQENGYIDEVISFMISSTEK